MSSLVTFGETMLRLAPPEGELLARVDSFDVHAAGAESNVAVAASALGLDALVGPSLRARPLWQSRPR